MSLKNAKAKGSKNERRSIAILEAAGYQCMKAGGSLGVWDICGIGSQDFVLVQVKSRDYPGTVEMEILKEFRVPPNCRKLVHRWLDYKKLPDVREL